MTDKIIGASEALPLICNNERILNSFRELYMLPNRKKVSFMNGTPQSSKSPMNIWRNTIKNYSILILNFTLTNPKKNNPN